MDFRTKLDYSKNRQINQRAGTFTNLKGGTTFGVDVSALPTGYDPNTEVITQTLNSTGMTTTFSGNSTDVNFVWHDGRMSSATEIVKNKVIEGVLNVINPTITTTYKGDNISNNGEFNYFTNYVGTSFDFKILNKTDVGSGNYTGVIEHEVITFYDAKSIDYSGSTTWINNVGNTKTKELQITKNAGIGKVFKCLNSDGDGEWANQIITGTYSELKAIKDANKLIIGGIYLLTDYQTKYIINSSDSSEDIKKFDIIGNSGSFTQFSNVGVGPGIFENGDTAIVDSLPNNYGGSFTVGQTLTVVNRFNSAYIQFSPTTGPSEIGLTLKSVKQRYSEVVTNSTINDVNGKPIFKKNGVLNTEVHDGTPYMSMTGLENPKPIVESIILTAIDSDKFSIFSESLTFPGDSLEYDFNNTQLKNDNGEVIPNISRNGLILKRSNLTLDISVDKDWRVQRYRRFKVDEPNWEKMVYRSSTQGSLYKANTSNDPSNPSNQELNYFSESNGSITDEHKFVALSPNNTNMYFDFNKIGPNPFVDGVPIATGNGAIFGIDKRTSSNNGSSVLYDININGAEFITLNKVRDLHIFPINNFMPDPLVSSFNVNTLSNTVFRKLSQRYGDSDVISLNTIGEVYNSTFSSGSNVTGSGSLVDVISVDSLNLKNDGYCTGLRWFINGGLNNKGVLNHVVFGSLPNSSRNNHADYYVSSTSILSYTMVGIVRSANLMFDNFHSYESMLQYSQPSSLLHTGSIYLTKVNTTHDLFMTGVIVKLKTLHSANPKTNNYGFNYHITGATGTLSSGYSDSEYDNLTDNKDLINRSVNNTGNLVIKKIASPK